MLVAERSELIEVELFKKSDKKWQFIELCQSLTRVIVGSSERNLMISTLLYNATIII